MEHKELLTGLVRLHILYHASKRPIFGLWIIEELGHHGYRLSPGTVYPLLRSLERRGYLRSSPASAEPRVRRLYKITSQGRQALKEAKEKVRELFGELFED